MELRVLQSLAEGEEPQQLERIIIPRGTQIWRCAPNFELTGKCLTARQCSDTSKSGVYFGTYPYLSLAICLEYGQALKLAEFIVTDDIIVSYGKYSFQDMDPAYKEYFKNLRKGLVGPDAYPFKEEHNLSHFDDNAYPIIPVEQEFLRGFRFEYDARHGRQDGEVFLSDTSGDLSNIAMRRSWQVTDLNRLRQIMIGCRGVIEPFDVEFYSEVLMPLITPRNS